MEAAGRSKMKAGRVREGMWVVILGRGEVDVIVGEGDFQLM
jgi:hypothetical protein